MGSPKRQLKLKSTGFTVLIKLLLVTGVSVDKEKACMQGGGRKTETSANSLFSDQKQNTQKNWG